MRRVAALFLSIGLAPLSANAAAPSAFERKLSEWTANGFTVKDHVERSFKDVALAAAVYSAADGSGDRLEAYVILHDKIYLGYAHPSQSERIEIDGSQLGRGFSDLFHDGSRVLMYHSTIKALNASSLHVLTFKSFKFSDMRVFPEGRLLVADAKPFVVARDLPLGRFLSVGCQDFATISQTAFRSRLFEFKKGGFVETTQNHPEFFASEISRKTAALERLKADLQKNAGEYIGLVISLYYDYAARNEARNGWERQKELFQTPELSSSRAQTCVSSMRQDLRGRLGIPPDWP